MRKSKADIFAESFGRERIDAGDWVCGKCSNENWKVWIPKENELCPSCKNGRKECEQKEVGNWS